jgi:allophanate hydrolase subunit 2
MASLRVVGLAGTALFQDAGRDHIDSGVPVSGAFDRSAHAAATALVAGAADEASLEVVGLIQVEPDVPITCALTGRGTLTVDGRTAGAWTALDVPAGARVEVRADGRAYLAVAGGFQPRSVLGSRSTCLLGPIGPAPVGVGDRLPLSPACTSATSGDFVRPAEPLSAVRIVAGPHLRVTPCEVQVVDVSRIGVRLTAGRVEVPPDPGTSDLPSLGVLPGALQVLPSGDWMLLGPDAGTMGGYPVAGVVATADLGLWAHVIVGDVVRLEVVDPAECRDASTPGVIHVQGLGG